MIWEAHQREGACLGSQAGLARLWAPASGPASRTWAVMPVLPVVGPCTWQEPLCLPLTAGEQRSGGVTEASSLLGGSPRRPCGRKGSPYHTGQLHPAVRVADLLQHINQMKTAEGYGFKQEYEVHAQPWCCQHTHQASPAAASPRAQPWLHPGSDRGHPALYGLDPGPHPGLTPPWFLILLLTLL